MVYGISKDILLVSQNSDPFRYVLDERNFGMSLASYQCVPSTEPKTAESWNPTLQPIHVKVDVDFKKSGLRSA
jgi:hypothetical protein